MNPQLEVYIQQSRGAGKSDEEIKQSLLDNGWSQEQIGEAFPGPASGQPVPPPLSPSPISSSDFFDQKTKDTMQWYVIGSLIPFAIEGLALGIFFRLWIWSDIFYHLFGYAIGAIIIAKLYPFFIDISRKYLGNFFNSLFKIIFYPVIIGAVLSAVTGGGFSSWIGTSFGFGLGGYFFTLSIVSIVANVLGGLIFAKFVVSKIGHYYPSA
ncbi:MAG TPA: hypothetical protein VJI73_04605 [Candidatus Paceibacterota bacterium]